MSSDLNNILGLQAWTDYIRGLVAFSGDTTIIESFDWTQASNMTVGQYLGLLDTAETALTSFNWSLLSPQLPFIESQLLGQGLPAATVALALGFLNDFIAGDLSVITEGFDFVRAAFADVAPGTALMDAINGGGTGGGLVETGGSGPNTMVGGAGDDDLSGLGGNDRLTGNGGDDTLNGGAGRDKLNGGAGNDDLVGGGGKDRLAGGAGRDDLQGGSGNDTLLGGGGNDTLNGGGGRDVLNGGTGNDSLFGGGGADRFVFRGRDGSDTINDFDVGVDHIKIVGAGSLSDIDFVQQGSDVVLSYGRLEVTVTGVTLAEMQDADNFLF